MKNAFAVVRRLWVKISKPGLLGRLSHGRGGRAALVLIGAHLLPVPVCGLLWLFGTLPIFHDARWIPIGLVSIVALVAFALSPIMFGFWGVGANSGQDGGDQFTDFRPLVAYGLGWLRWLMQVLMIMGMAYAVIFTITDFRLWHVTSTPELDALPARAATMPVPANWTLTDTQTGDDGDNPAPNGFYERRYDVPAGYGFARMKTWFSGPWWANRPGGRAFGALQGVHCDSMKGSTDCQAALVPAQGGQPKYTVRAWFDAPLSGDDLPEVRLRLTYTEEALPEDDVDVSQETLDRAAQIPIPSGWYRTDVFGGPSDSGESYVQTYALPESSTFADLKTWLDGPAWTHPAAGKAFGAVKMSYPCKKLSDHYLCSMTVTEPESDGPIESLLVSYKPADHTAMISFDRNG